MNATKIIGFDLDGVIVNHAPLRIEFAKSRGWELTPHQTSSEIIEHILPPSILDELKYTLYSDPVMALSAPLMPGARESLAALTSCDAPLFLISIRKSDTTAIQLLEKHGLWPRCFSPKNAFFVAKPEDKDVKAKELGITHYVDDEIRVLNALVSVKNKFLFDPIASFAEYAGYARVTSWDELMQQLL